MLAFQFCDKPLYSILNVLVASIIIISHCLNFNFPAFIVKFMRILNYLVIINFKEVIGIANNIEQVNCYDSKLNSKSFHSSS